MVLRKGSLSYPAGERARVGLLRLVETCVGQLVVPAQEIQDSQVCPGACIVLNSDGPDKGMLSQGKPEKIKCNIGKKLSVAFLFLLVKVQSKITEKIPRLRRLGVDREAPPGGQYCLVLQLVRVFQAAISADIGQFSPGVVADSQIPPSRSQAWITLGGVQEAPAADLQESALVAG